MATSATTPAPDLICIVAADASLHTGANIILQLKVTNTAVQVYNGSSYVDVVTGLTAGAVRTISITFGQGDTTCTIVVNGTTYTSQALRNTCPASIGRIHFGQSAAATIDYAWCGDISIAPAA
jgi:hypothetical protein